MKILTNRELRLLRKEWRKTVAESAYLSRIGCPMLSREAWERAEALEQKIKEYQ